MKASLNWIKDYLNIDLEPEKVGELLTDIGLEVEGMEEVESIKGGLEGVVVGFVKECGRHPNADKLSVTKVDVGREEPLNIVCGAPNVASGQKVLVATIGTVLYPNGGEEPLKIKKGKIRGEVSEGMICAEDELGLGTSHDGIMVLPEEVEIGTLAKDYFQIEKDYVYEIGLTPNRSDATSHIGIAKDLKAALMVNHDYQGGLNLPPVETFKVENTDLTIEVEVVNTEACPRYAGVSIQGIVVKESPDWLKTRLQAIGVRPISNIVDITNFVLHEFGQPLHAFDLDAITGNKIIVQTLPAGTSFISLDEVDRSLNAEDLMICDGDSNGMCIGGVFGGLKSGVKDTTKNIFLESAHFHPKWIRRSSMRHNLRTDAAKVFEKGSDPNIAVMALKRAALLIQELAEGTIASEIIDIYPNPILPKEVEVRYHHVTRLIGQDIPKEEIRQILAAMGIEIILETDEMIKVAIPTDKSDVTREADVIEEILRIYGFNKVPVSPKLQTTITVAPKPDPNVIRNIAGDYLAANGFHEIMAVSLTESKYFKEVLTAIPEEELVYVNNTSNIHLDIMRPTMLFSGLEAVVRNQNRQQSNLKIFEFGKSYRKAEKGYKEQEHLSLFMTGNRWKESWLAKDSQEVNYYHLKGFVQNLLSRFGITGYQETAFKDDIFMVGMRYHRGPQALVSIGHLTPGILQKMGIRGSVFYADFHWDNVMKALSKSKIYFEELNKFPTVRRDLALVIDNSVKFSDIVAIAKKHGKKLIKEIDLFDIYENEDQLGKGKKSYAISFIFEDPAKTLKDKEVDKVMNQLIQTAENQLGAIIRR